jgi:hypothetical protein
MPKYWRPVFILSYWALAMVLASTLMGLFPWPTVVVSMLFAWIYVRSAGGHVAVPPIAAFVLTLVAPFVVTMPIMLRTSHSWSAVFREIVRVLWDNWAFWAIAGLLPIGCALLAALLAMRHRRGTAKYRVL